MEYRILIKILVGKVLWRNLHNCPTASKIKDLQWKCAHNIIYTEFLLSKMGLSNGKCHFCVHHTETLDHLFFHCVKIQEFLNKVFTYMYQNIPGSHDFEFTIYNVMLGFDIDNDITCICNLLLFTAKWGHLEREKFNQISTKSQFCYTAIQHVQVHIDRQFKIFCEV